MEKFTLAVLFEGQIRRVKNVTRYATCRDVMHKLLSDLHQTNSTGDFSLFEVTDGLGRMLADRERIMQVVRSWGTEEKHFQIVMKSNVIELGQTESSAGESDADLDNTLLGTADVCPTKSLSTAALAERKLVKSENENQMMGKLSVLRRFFTDLPTHTCTRPNRKLTLRGHGDCAQVSGLDCGQDTWNTSDDITLDVAFVKSCTDICSDDGIDIESVTSVDLNAAFIGNYSDTRNRDVDSDSGRGTLSETSSGDYVRRLFDFGGKISVVSQDAELDSFMNTRIYDPDTDEGVSSSGSDVIIVRKETSV